MMSDFTDQVVLVTGASKGIGAAIARAFGRARAKVVVNYASSKAGADLVVAEIEAAGGTAIAVQASLTEEQDVIRLFAETKRRYGTLHVLVNNAGVYAFSPLAEVTAAEFHRQFNINVLGLLLACREAVPLFGPDGGSIINISSVASTFPMPNNAVYAGTKGAVDTITRVLAVELGPRKIRVNGVNPGLVITEGSEAFGTADPESPVRKMIEAQTPLGRVGQPDDVASTVLHLASKQADWVTGELWAISGGLR